MTPQVKRTPWYLWPFKALWQLVAAIIKLTGRLVAVVLGFALILVGVVLSATLVGAILGVPMLLFGLLLIFRGLF